MSRTKLLLGLSVGLSAVVAMLAGIGLESSPARDSRSAATPAELVVWDWSYFPSDDKKTLDVLDRMFMKANPDVRIKHVGIPFNTAYAKFRTAIAARKGPDVVTLYPGTFAADYRKGLVPLNDKIPSWMRQQVPMLRSSAAPDGNIYALPLTAYGYVWAYNKALFRKAGLNPNKPPSTWPQFLDACSKLRTAGVEPITAAWKDGYLLEWFLYVYGGQLLSKSEAKRWANGDLPVNNPKFARALDLALSLDAKNCFQDGAASRVVYNDMNDDFSAQKTAMLLWYGGTSDFKKWETGLGRSNVGLFLPPRLPGSPYPRIMDTGPNNGLAITNWSKQQDAAWRYLAFRQTRAAQAAQWKLSQALPNNATVSLTSTSPITKQMLGFLRIKDNYTIYTGFPASIVSILDQQAPRVVSGELSVKALLDQMEAAMARLRPKLKSGS